MMEQSCKAVIRIILAMTQFPSRILFGTNHLPHMASIVPIEYPSKKNLRYPFKKISIEKVIPAKTLVFSHQTTLSHFMMCQTCSTSYQAMQHLQKYKGLNLSCFLSLNFRHVSFTTGLSTILHAHQSCTLEKG